MVHRNLYTNLVLFLAVLVSLPLITTVYRGLTFRGFMLVRNGSEAEEAREYATQVIDTLIGILLFSGIGALFMAALYYRYPG